MPAPSLPGCTVVQHPLVLSKITVLRDKRTDCELFRRTLHELAALVAWEATKDLAVEAVEIESPLQRCSGHVLARPVVLMPILRAGLGMVSGILEILPEARIGHVGLCRDEETFEPRSYYFKAPPDLPEADVLLVDPMLATGQSASDAAAKLKALGATRLRLLALVGCVQGATHFRERHPDVPVFLAALDRELSDKAYIVPGLGDAGDRYFGT